MKKIKVITILGTRPEVIKLAPVIKELKKKKCKIISKTILTGQHRQMVRQFLELFHIRPDYNLDIMHKDQSLFDITSRCLQKLSKVLKEEKPDLILIEGDTTTAFISSLCAFYLKIPVGHVEAGLRTYNKYQPYPEEINRRLISVVGDLHFAPTKIALKNLLNEGIRTDNIYLTGNTVVDALYSISNKKYSISNKNINGIDFRKKKVILITAHRRESFGGPLAQICKAIKLIAEFPNVEIIYPVHLNPNVKKPVEAILKNKKNIHLLPPLDYLSFVYVLKNCYLVLTDSGGVQEEAPAFGKPILVMREVTERPEGIKAQIAKVVGMDSKRIVSQTRKLIFSAAAYRKMAKAVNPYGDGQAARRIVKAIADYFQL